MGVYKGVFAYTHTTHTQHTHNTHTQHTHNTHTTHTQHTHNTHTTHTQHTHNTHTTHKNAFICLINLKKSLKKIRQKAIGFHGNLGTRERLKKCPVDIICSRLTYALTYAIRIKI